MNGRVLSAGPLVEPGSRFLRLLVAILLLLPWSIAIAQDHEYVLDRTAIARDDPDEAMRKLHQLTGDEYERFVRFAVCFQLGKESLISSEDFCMILDRARFEVDAKLRAERMTYVNHAFKGKQLSNIYGLGTFDKSHFVRYNTAEAMRDHPDEALIPHLDDLLDDVSTEVRDVAAHTLFSWYSSHELGAAKGILLKSQKSSDIRRAGTASLMLVHDPDETPRTDVIVEYLRLELSGPSRHLGGGDLRVHLRTLGSTGDATARDFLLTISRHSNPSIAKAASATIREFFPSD